MVNIHPTNVIVSLEIFLARCTLAKDLKRPMLFGTVTIRKQKKCVKEQSFKCEDKIDELTRTLSDKTMSDKSDEIFRW